MKQKPRIIYQKRGEKLKSIKLNSLRILLNLPKDIGHITGGSMMGTRLCINKEIEFIKFENVTFDKVDGIECEENTTCILKNCNLTTPSYRKFELETGNFTIINPIVKNDTEFNLDGTTNVKFSFRDKNENRYEIHNDDYVSKTVKINDNRSINRISLKVPKVNLNGFYSLQDLWLPDNNEVIIGNSENHTEIITSNYLVIDTTYLYLSNCTIQNDSKSHDAELLSKNLIGKNFIIKSKTRILIYGITITDKNDEKYKRDKNKNCYYLVERDKDGYITITDKDLLRLNLISSLIALREQINENIEKEVEEHIQKNIYSKSDLSRTQEELNEEQANYEVALAKYEVTLAELNKAKAKLNEAQEKIDEKQRKYDKEERKIKSKIKSQLYKRTMGHYTNNRRNKNEE